MRHGDPGDAATFSKTIFKRTAYALDERSHQLQTLSRRPLAFTSAIVSDAASYAGIWVMTD
jgi:hypothetical protein